MCVCGGLIEVPVWLAFLGLAGLYKWFHKKFHKEPTEVDDIERAINP